MDGTCICVVWCEGKYFWHTYLSDMAVNVLKRFLAFSLEKRSKSYRDEGGGVQFLLLKKKQKNLKSKG